MLTTPKMTENRDILPTQNWFLYWKSSPSLWEEQLRDYTGIRPLMIPIYWAGHHFALSEVDFGQLKPENDLSLLSEILQRLNLDAVFLLPIGPVPFLAQGGVPNFMNLTQVVNPLGLNSMTLDRDGRVNHMYSFFDPSLFSHFRKFLRELSHLFSSKGINQPVYGLHSFYLQGNLVQSFFNDSSEVFENGFKKFLANQDSGAINESKDLAIHQSEFRQLIFDLYLEACNASLGPNWVKVIDVCFIGASLDSLISRVNFKRDMRAQIIESLLQVISNNMIPTTILLEENQHNSLTQKALADIVTEGLIQSKLSDDLYDGEHSGFSPLSLFELFIANANQKQFYAKSGLLNYLDDKFKWSYRFNTHLEHELEDSLYKKVYSFSQIGNNITAFNTMLKLFMNGAKVIVDITDLDPDLKRKLELFFLENSLKVEKVNFVSPTQSATLGDGQIILYESSYLTSISHAKQMSYWERVIEFLDVIHLNIESDFGVYYFWKTRLSSPYELSFEEIRRVSLFNTTDEHKRVRVLSNKNFALAKIVDQVDCQVKNSPIGVEMLLAPSGSISLDFGFYDR
jgi:predicted transcriptional regulator